MLAKRDEDLLIRALALMEGCELGLVSARSCNVAPLIEANSGGTVNFFSKNILPFYFFLRDVPEITPAELDLVHNYGKLRT